MKKTTNYVIAILVIFTIAIPIVSLQPNFSVEAQTQYTNMQEGGSIPLPENITPDVRVPTVACLSFRPNPVGVGQLVLINIWTLPALHVSRYIKDYTLTITKPDGTQEIIKKDSYRADATSWVEYTPNQVGTYKIKFDFLGAYWPTGNYTVEPGGSVVLAQILNLQQSVYHEPSSSPELTLVVQEEPVLSWSETPLPTDYWTRPIPLEHRDWWVIGGNYPWRGTGGGPEWDTLYPKTNPYWGDRQRFTPWVQAPESAHVVWKKQGTIAGLMGGDMRSISLTGGGGNPTLIYEGRAYESITKVFNGELQSVWQCYDIRTGEIIWERNDIPANQRPTMIHYTEQALGRGAVPGAQAYKRGLAADLISISGGYHISYDPWTGAVRHNVSIAPLTTATFYKDPCFLSVQNLGNSVPVTERYRLINWTLTGQQVTGLTYTYNFDIISNITWPWANLGTAQDFGADVAVWITDIDGAPGARTARRVRTASLVTGLELWDKTFNETYYQSAQAIADHGKLAMATIKGDFVALDLKTGNQLWRSETMDYPWDYSFAAYSISSAYGFIYSARYSGVYAIDWETGKIAWKYEAPAKNPYDSPYINENGTSVHPFFIASWVADGKLYISNTEHTPVQPITRGWKTHCIDAITGEGIWNVMVPGSIGPIADGYMSISSTDGFQYVFGKGRSQTSVSVPATNIKAGESFTITGTVVDLSPAQQNTAAISDDDMPAWMEYIHRQMPKPTDAKGVTVTLKALDPNNNLIDIGQTTSNTDGVYGFTWAPEVPGLYQIIATFAGSDSYGSSSASTYFTAVEAPVVITPQTPTPQTSIAETYFVPAIAALFIAIIIVGAILSILMLKKRP